MVAPADTPPAAHGTVQKHLWHMVDPSPWPVVGALSAGVLAIGTVFHMHGGGIWVLVLGVLGILVTMYFWFRDVVMEATFRGHHSAPVQISMRYGMVLFIASEVMFFAAWFWAFFNASLFPPASIKGVWPPPGVVPFDPWQLPFLNTLILLTSGVTVTWAHHALLEGNRKHLIQGLGLTILLGLAFTGIQAYEFGQAAFDFKDGIYSTTFYMATGFHGFHVIVGTIFLIVCFFRAKNNHFKAEQHFGFEAAAWYWHFVDVVWLFLFTCIYWWGSGNAFSH
ncbi:cytochrome c oxidase subunit 3 [Alphaproteobacteria bacterium]|nr:cytochrome c oxidase subunit 3 [Alphaproteobacteria bacterium]